MATNTDPGVENAVKKLRNSIDKSTRITKWQNGIMILLSIVMVILTIVIIKRM